MARREVKKPLGSGWACFVPAGEILPWEDTAGAEEAPRIKRQKRECWLMAYRPASTANPAHAN